MTVNIRGRKASVYTRPNGSRDVLVNSVHVDGVVDTLESIVRAQVTPLFRVTNFDCLSEELQRTAGRLNALNVFSNVTCLLDPYTSKKNPEHCTVYFDVKEKGKWSFLVWPLFPSANHLSLHLGLERNNISGKCRSLVVGGNCTVWNQFGASNGEFGFSLFSPSRYNPLIHSTLGLGICSRPSGLPHRHALVLRNVIRFPVDKSQISYHDLKTTVFIDAAWGRQREDLVIRAEHCFVRDSRVPLDGWPVCGSLAQVRSVLQVFGWPTYQRSGSAQEVSLSAFVSPFSRFPRFTLSGGVRMGMLLADCDNGDLDVSNYCLDHCPSHLLTPVDGPAGIRGVRAGSLQARHRAAAGLHCHFPVPFLSSVLSSVLRCHLFATCGNSDNSAGLCVKKLASRCSMGFGLSAAVAGICHAELNVCVPLRGAIGDMKPGVQFGIGTDFL